MRAVLFFLCFRFLGAVLGAGLAAILDACRIERTTDDVVANAREVLDTTAADENNTMLLEIMTNARNVCSHLDAVRQTNTSGAVDFSCMLFLLLRTNWLIVGIHAPPSFILEFMIY